MIKGDVLRLPATSLLVGGSFLFLTIGRSVEIETLFLFASLSYLPTVMIFSANKQEV
jgi:hypothetical protein